MRHSYDKSGALTAPRELKYDDATQQLVSNPVRELSALRNGTIATETNMPLATGVLHTISGTEEGVATSADIELEFALPLSDSSSGAVEFSAVVLANGAYVVGGGDNISSGVTVALTLAPPRGSNSIRKGIATISAVGAAPCVAASPYCENATKPQNGATVSTSFTVLANETALSLRIIVDRVLVEVFVQGGRVAFTKSFVPPRWQNSAVHLLAQGTTTTMVLNRMHVWSMGCGWVDHT